MLSYAAMRPEETASRRASSPREGYWGAHLRYEPERELVWRELARVIQEDVPEHGRLLELGAGYCYFVNHIRALERHALDTEPRVREFAGDGVKVHVGSCTDLRAFADGSLDVVFASNLFEHLTREQFEATVREARRVLAPGGRLIALQPNYRHCAREYFDDYTHVTVFTDWSLARWLEALGFRVTKMVPRFMPGDFRSSRPKWPWLVRAYLALPTWLRPLAQQMYCVAEKPRA